MPVCQTIPAEEEALLQKPKSSIRRVIVCAAALSFALGAVAATAGNYIVDGGKAASLSSKPGWGACDWIESNSNTDGEQYVAYAGSPSGCIAMVRERYPDATIANIDDSGVGGCYAQFGSAPTKDKSGWMWQARRRSSGIRATIITSCRSGRSATREAAKTTQRPPPAPKKSWPPRR